MANHVEFLRLQAGTQTVRAAAQGNTLAMVVTDDEIICGRAGLLGRFGNRVERYSLGRLSDVEVLPNPSASMLQLRFAGPEEELCILFPSSARTALQDIVGALQSRLPQAAAGVAR